MYSLKCQCWIVSAQMVALIIVFLPSSTSVVVPGSIPTFDTSSRFLSRPVNVTLRKGDTYQLILMIDTCDQADFWIDLGENCRLSPHDGESQCNAINMTRLNVRVCDQVVHDIECNQTQTRENNIFETNIVVDEQFIELFDNQTLRVSFGYTGATSHANIRYVSDNMTASPACDATPPTPTTPQCTCATTVVTDIPKLSENIYQSSSLRLGNMLLSTWLISISVFVSVVLTLSL